MQRLLPLFFTLMLLALQLSTAKAENWPQWRGPTFNGATTETGLPATWSKTENVAWSTPLPGASGATPIIFGDKVFLSSADKPSKDLLALCINRKDGKVLWQKTVAPSSDREKGKNNMGSPSPVTDGKVVCFLFGTGDLAAFDFEGTQLWNRNIQKDHGKFAIMWGYGSSPLLYKGKLYVQVLQRDKQMYVPGADQSANVDSYLLAIDPMTGKDLWKHVRPCDAKEETRESYATPIPFEGKDRAEIVLTGGDCVTGHNPETGDEFWRFGGWNPTKINHWRMVTSVTTGNDMIFASGPKHSAFFAIKAGGSGDVTSTHQAWTFNKDLAPDVCTPLYYKDMLYVLDGDKKTMTCLNPKTGETKWQGKLPGLPVYSASPTCGDDKIYCVNEAGEATVLAVGDAFKVLGTIPMQDGKCFSSISISNSHLFIRTYQNLWCIGTKE